MDEFVEQPQFSIWRKKHFLEKIKVGRRTSLIGLCTVAWITQLYSAVWRLIRHNSRTCARLAANSGALKNDHQSARFLRGNRNPSHHHTPALSHIPSVNQFASFHACFPSEFTFELLRFSTFIFRISTSKSFQENQFFQHVFLLQSRLTYSQSR